MRGFALVAMLALIAAPAFAADGNIPASTLNSLGLSGMQTVSDAQGMQVRGMQGAFAMVKGTSLIFGQLLTPDTKNFVSFSSVNEVDGNFTTEAVTAFSLTKSHSVLIDPLNPVTLNVTYTGLPALTFSGTITGGVGGVGFISMP